MWFLTPITETVVKLSLNTNFGIYLGLAVESTFWVLGRISCRLEILGYRQGKVGYMLYILGFR
jgi:hypothetical protein